MVAVTMGIWPGRNVMGRAATWLNVHEFCMAAAAGRGAAAESKMTRGKMYRFTNNSYRLLVLI
jgi:hypothetical protein